MNNIVTEKIKLWGIVQGVGFRPFVAKLALQMGMKGRVMNLGGLVEIHVTDARERIDEFLRRLKEEKPEPAEIVHLKREATAFQAFESFSIMDSHQGEDEAAMIPAHLALCKHCESELKDPENPRYRHPFISCMICGPRYTIIDKIPYDRENTCMVDFPMCEFCNKEYTDRTDRRYHAQTISCHACGPQLELVKNSGDPVEEAVKLLQEGKILGFKSVGGYNLICNPLNDAASSLLRKVKGREEKPFAMMFQDMEMLRGYCHCSQEEENLLKSAVRPIVLLEKKKRESEPDEFKKSRFIGSFLPSMGAQILLLEKFGGPVIMTSANISERPMIKDEEEMLLFLEESQGGISDILNNKRRINVRVDDSVARIIDGQPQMIRRSKGYVPVPLHVGLGEHTKDFEDKDTMILATGAQLKNSFALSKGPFSYVSQYIGDLDTVENCQIYEENITRMKHLFRIEPKMVVCDMHPRYHSTEFGKDYARTHGIPLLQVQHHHAHVASVQAEHGLDEPVIGVSLDGTGYGTDDKIWGGEILLCQGSEFERLSHLKYIKMIGGDSSMKEAWKSAMCYWHDSMNPSGEGPGEGEFAIDITDIMALAKLEKNKNWPLIKAALEHEVNTLESSSMGRLFDAVSSMLGICQVNQYEGQCAMLLEDAAARALNRTSEDEADRLALAFHYRVADAVIQQCEKYRELKQVNKVALTGGVFQNKILMERCLELLRKKGFQVYYNISVSPNDGGIALGQNYLGMHKLKKRDSGQEETWL